MSDPIDRLVEDCREAVGHLRRRIESLAADDAAWRKPLIGTLALVGEVAAGLPDLAEDSDDELADELRAALDELGTAMTRLVELVAGLASPGGEPQP
jgi:hypothetical protein